MKHNHSNINLRELKAESILSLQDLQDFVVEMKGIFYRNYSPDLMSNPVDKEEIELSRDGILHLLPEGLFFNEDDPKNSEIFDEKKEKSKLFFRPFDTEYFNLSLKLEKEINRISGKSNFSLTDFLSRDILPETEEDFLSLSGFVSAIRGNEALIIDILKIILNVPKIELIKIDNFVCSGVIRKRFIIHISNLSTEQYAQKNHQISGIFEIFKEYFLPFEIEYDFKIKDRQQKFILHENLILDYNINL